MAGMDPPIVFIWPWRGRAYDLVAYECYTEVSNLAVHSRAAHRTRPATNARSMYGRRAAPRRYRAKGSCTPAIARTWDVLWVTKD